MNEFPTLAIRCSRVFDGERLTPASTVLLRGACILAVGDDVDVPDGVEVLDGDECTLLPGLIDAHTHLHNERELQQALAFGVTTELDMYTFLPPELGRELRRQLAAGRTDLADFRMAMTPVTSPRGLGVRFNPDIPTLADAANAPAFVDARLAEGADYIKIMYEDGYLWGSTLPNLSPEMMRAAVDAAHERGRLAVTHATSRHGARAALEAGSDGLAHVICDEVPDDELCRDAAERGMFLIATLTVVEGVFGGSSGAGLATDERLTPYLHARAVQNLQATKSTRTRRGSFSIAKQAVRRMHEAGVRILAGTDVTNRGTAHGVSIHRELELLVQAGLTPSEALAAATSRCADCFRLDDRGRITPGHRADLLMVRGDPTRDIFATRDIVAVIRGGVLVDRAALASAIASSDH